MLFVLGLPRPVVAWGEKGHAVVGVLAMEQLDDASRGALSGILESMAPERIASACYWPDRIRDAGMADWSVPLHYVSVDPDAGDYQRARDCPDGQCLPEAILHYAGVLADTSLDMRERREAFNFLCHFTGDLHQPLHVGFADDEGGNLVTVRYQGGDMKLHWFWDGGLIDTRVDDWQQLADLLRARRNLAEPAWSPAQVTAWANESHAFTRHSAYPQQREIDAGFEAHAWQVVLHQLDMAATRLAGLLEAVLADAVDPGDGDTAGPVAD